MAALEGRCMKTLILISIVMVCVIGGCAQSEDPPSTAASVAGDLTHDFGRIDLNRDPVTKTHTFELTNTTHAPIIVTDVKSTCGCTKAELSARTIPAGKSVAVTVGMQFTSSGTKTAQVHLITQRDATGPIILTVAGQGRSLRQIRVAETVRMKPGETRSVPIIASSYMPQAAPPIFAVDAPAFIHTELHPWSMMQTLDSDRGVAAKWRGLMEVSVSHDAKAGLHKIALNSEFGAPKVVSVRVR
jgi:hypothetical protein